MVAAEKVAARPDLADGVHRLAVLAEVDALGEHVHHAELVDVHHELLVARRRARPPASRPRAARSWRRPAASARACWRSHRPPARRGSSRRRASRRCGTACRAAARAGRRRKSTSAGSGVPKVGAPDCIEIVETKVPKITGAPGPDELDEGGAGQHLGQHLGQRAGDRHRAHRAGQDERRDDHGLVRRAHRPSARRAWWRRTPSASWR